MFAIEFFNWYDDVMWEQENRPNSSVQILKIFRLLWTKFDYYKVHKQSSLQDVRFLPTETCVLWVNWNITNKSNVTSRNRENTV